MLSKLPLWLRLVVYRVRLRSVMPFMGSKEVHPTCPHDIRIPLERVWALSEAKQDLLEKALIDTMRPFGCTISRCRRCHSLVATCVTKNRLGE